MRALNRGSRGRGRERWSVTDATEHRILSVGMARDVGPGFEDGSKKARRIACSPRLCPRHQRVITSFRALRDEFVDTTSDSRCSRTCALVYGRLVASPYVPIRGHRSVGELAQRQKVGRLTPTGADGARCRAITLQARRSYGHVGGQANSADEAIVDEL